MSETFLLPNGRYTSTLTSTDLQGNTATKAGPRFTVRIPKPHVRVATTTGAKDGALTATVTGPAYAQVTLWVQEAPGSKRTVSLGQTGHAQTQLDLADGAYRLIASLTDFQKRRARRVLRHAVVDTLGPSLTLAPDARSLTHGVLALGVVTEEGSTLTVTGTPLAGDRVATASSMTLGAPVREGTYAGTVTASDRYGNTTTVPFRLRVTRPMSAAQIAAWLLLLLGLMTGLVLGWRRRESLADWLRHQRALVEHRRALKRFRVAQAAHQAAVAEHGRKLEDHHQQLEAWRTRRAELQGRVQLATAFEVQRDQLPVPAGFRAKRDEHVLAVMGGEFLDGRSQAGNLREISVDTGRIVVTDKRVSFVGSAKHRDWDYNKLNSLRIAAKGYVRMVVSSRQHPSGVRPATGDDDLMFWVQLAVSEHRGERSGFLAELRGQHAAHLLRAPQPPTAPPPAPTAPLRPVRTPRPGMSPAPAQS